MRYFTSMMSNPSPWKETTESDELKFIASYCECHLKIYDADNSGKEVVYFAFSSGKFFKVTYSWYIEVDPEWRLIDHYEIVQIKESEAEDLCVDRDWMVLKT